MTYLILEYEQDESQDATYKAEGTHPPQYTESAALEYVKKHDVHGKIFVYHDTDYLDYQNDVTDEVPDPVEIIDL